MPEGIEHPFAKTMMAHFDKIHTPLGSIRSYPTTHAQEKRFIDLGWSNVTARNLWYVILIRVCFHEVVHYHFKVPPRLNTKLWYLGNYGVHRTF